MSRQLQNMPEQGPDSAISCQNVQLTFHVPQRRQRVKDVALSMGRSLRPRKIEALKGVTFEVDHSEILGVIGNNGAGKSTLLRVLGGIYRPESGSVFVDGTVGMVMALGAGFHPDLTGRDNIQLNAALIGMSDRLVAERLENIVEWSGLAEFIDMEMRHYSSGMRARLGFAISVELRPDILLIDEVLSVGDADFQEKCNEKFQEFVAAGTTIILVTHSLGLVEDRCTKVLWLDRGEVRELGETDYVLAAYRDEISRQHAVSFAKKQEARPQQEKRVEAPDEKEGSDSSPAPKLLYSAATASAAAPALPTAPKRWGSGEITIDTAMLCGESGQPKYMFNLGEYMRFDLHYRQSSPVTGPQFGIQITTLSGERVTGANTFTHKYPMENVGASGVFSIEIPRPDFALGKYLVSFIAFCLDNNVRKDFDVRENLIMFEITTGPRWRFGPTWLHDVKFHNIAEPDADQSPE